MVPHSPALGEGAPRTRRFGFVNLQGIISLFGWELRREWRFFGPGILGPALQAALFAIVFALAGMEAMDGKGGRGENDRFLDFLMPGLIFSAIAIRAFETAAYRLMYDKLHAGLDDLLRAPMLASEIMCGHVAANLAVSGAIGMSVAVALIPFGMAAPPHPLAAAGFLTATVIFFSSLGLGAAILSEKWDTLAAKETFILMPLTFLSGAFFPPTALPEGFWQVAFRLNPAHYMVDGFRHAMTGRGDGSPELAALLAVSCAVGAFVLVYALWRSGYRLKP